MRIAKIFGGQVVEIDEASVLFPNTSFSETGPNDEFLAEHSCLRVVDDVQFNNQTQKIVDVIPFISMGVVYTKVAVELTPEEHEARTADAWKAVRIQRDQYLRASDHVLLPDSPYNQAEKDLWIGYRDELRNIPQTQTDPTNIVWPTKP